MLLTDSKYAATYGGLDTRLSQTLDLVVTPIGGSLRFWPSHTYAIPKPHGFPYIQLRVFLPMNCAAWGLSANLDPPLAYVWVGYLRFWLRRGRRVINYEGKCIFPKLAKLPNPSGATTKFPLDSDIDANDTNTAFFTHVL